MAKFVFLTLIYVYVLPACMYIHKGLGLEGVSDSLELELWV